MVVAAYVIARTIAVLVGVQLAHRVCKEVKILDLSSITQDCKHIVDGLRINELGVDTGVSDSQCCWLRVGRAHSYVVGLDTDGKGRPIYEGKDA